MSKLSVTKTLLKVKSLVNKGKNEEAVKLCQIVFNTFPNNKRVQRQLVSLNKRKPPIEYQNPPQEVIAQFISLFNRGQMRDVCNKAYGLKNQFPKSDFLYNMLGAGNLALGHIEDALDNYRKAAQINPQNPDIQNNMGTALEKNGDLVAAVVAYRKAINLKPNFAKAYSNLGSALKKQGKLEESAKSLNQALTFNANDAIIWNNVGNGRKQIGEIEDAITAFNKALDIQPNYADAWNNKGNALKEIGKLEEAIEAFRKAITFKPNYFEAFNNIGVTFDKKGDLGDAISSLNKALEIKPDSCVVWNNIFFPLQSIKMQLSDKRELSAFIPQISNSTYVHRARAILNFRLSRGGDQAESTFNEALKLLSNSEHMKIINPKRLKKHLDKATSSMGTIISLVHFGRSGTGLLHSLIDGHPEVSTLPSIYFSEYFHSLTWEKIIAGGWNEMADRFIALYEVLFDATSTIPIQTKSMQFLDCVGLKEGMANVGYDRDEALSVDKTLFRSELEILMDDHDELNALTFFKIVQASYDKAINDKNKKKIIFYHIHNPHIDTQLNFVGSAINAKWIIMVREPVQSCESWIRDKFFENDHFSISQDIVEMLFETNNIIYRKQPSIGVRLEDLKERPGQTIPALCRWMGITENETLYEMTAQGKRWWGDPTSPDYKIDGMEPFGKTSINRKVGEILSQNDQFILRTLFYPFSNLFGYVEENLEQFKIDLQIVRTMLDQMFDFEKSIVERMEIDPNQFVKSGSYLYLRSGLVERWTTLNKYGTYPNMITPLRV